MNTKNLLDLAKYNTVEYGSYTIMNRAIPDFRDGLKPVHRRILWAMYVGNYHSNGNFKKSANVIGDTMGKFHPHGDCLRGNTKIYLLDGSVRTIKDIVESGIQSLSILSYDVENKKFIPAWAHSWRIGQETSIMYRIHLSENDDIIECTGNHQFLTLNGKWISADKLKDFDLLFGGNFKRVNYVCAKRIEKINLEKEEKFYDFTVDNYHNLVMLTSNNNYVITHNSGIYSSLVTLVNSPEPPIQGQGQWGSFRDPSRAAAARYTEVRLSKYGEKFLLDPIYIKSATLVDNYSGEYKEPLYLPTKVPNILINGSEGIATACSNLIPSFSLESVKELVIKKLNNELSIKDVANILKFKFTYGGKFIGNNLIDYLKTGKASLYFIPEFEINLEENLISLVSASPRFNLEKFMTKASEIKDIKSVDDLSAGDSINISIYTKNIDKRSKKEVIVKIKDLATTSLPCNTLITRRSEETTTFRKVSIVKLVDLWLEWRKSFEKKVVKRLLQEEDVKLKSQELIRLAIENRQVIKDSMEVREPEKYVSNKLKINLDDSNKILAFPVRKLAKIEIGKIDSAIEKINSEIKILKNTKIEKRIEESL